MSFGVEGKFKADFRKIRNGKTLFATLELFLNQPYGKNMLTDQERKKYIESFKKNSVEISRLMIGYKSENFFIGIGKGISNFGKFYFPIFINNYKFASPFIRSEAILLRETGIFFSYKLSLISLSLAIVNGEENMDTNSFKAGIVRLGFDFPFLKFGVSVKAHDGIGSEQQKIYKNHLGGDFIIKSGKFSLSGELIYDQYGFHKDFDESEIFWPTSVYYRDIFYKYNTPIEGIGGYLNFKIEGKKALLNFSYGQYIPQKIGHQYHDQDIKRFIVKIRKGILREISIFAVGILENEKEKREEWRKGEKGYAFLIGLEFKNEW